MNDNGQSVGNEIKLKINYLIFNWNKILRDYTLYSNIKD